MPQHTSMATMSESEARWAGALGYVAGILFLATFIVFGLAPQYTAAQTEQALAEYDRTSTFAALTTILFTLAIIAGIPFFLGLRSALRERRATWAGAATTFLIVGFVLFVALTLVQTAMTATLAEIYRTGTADQKATAVVVARTVAAVGAANSLASLALAAGTVLYGLVMWNSGVFPNWVASASIVTGIAFLVTLVTPFGAGLLGLILGAIILILFLVWIFGSAFFLSKRVARPSAMPT